MEAGGKTTVIVDDSCEVSRIETTKSEADLRPPRDSHRGQPGAGEVPSSKPLIQRVGKFGRLKFPTTVVGIAGSLSISLAAGS